MLDSLVEWLLTPLLLAAFFGWFVFSSRREKVARDKELAAFGARHGLKQQTFTVDVFGPRTVAYGEIWPDVADEFRLGRGRVTIRNVWRGAWDGGEVRYFEFDRLHVLGRALLFDSPSLDLPAFVVPPSAGVADPGGNAEGDGVTVDGLFVVTSEAMAVRRAFTPAVAAFFKERAEGRRTWAEGRGRRLLFYKQFDAPRKGHRPRPDFPADDGHAGFWRAGQALARLLATPSR